MRSSLSNKVSLTVTISHFSSGFPAGSEALTQEYFSCPERYAAASADWKMVSSTIPQRADASHGDSPAPCCAAIWSCWMSVLIFRRETCESNDDVLLFSM